MTKNPFALNMKTLDIYRPKESKRKPIKSGTRTNLMADSGAKCQKCKHSLKGLKPHIHHKNGNPKDNRPSNLILVCPNCHSKLHRNMKKTKNGTSKGNYITNVFGKKVPPMLRIS